MTLDPGMGIRFVDLPAEEANTIDRWIKESARREALGHQGQRSSLQR